MTQIARRLSCRPRRLSDRQSIGALGRAVARAGGKDAARHEFSYLGYLRTMYVRKVPGVRTYLVPTPTGQTDRYDR